MDETPALTPDEWQDAIDRCTPRPDKPVDLSVAWNWIDVKCKGNDPHALAALCLYQQPFGFTQEDVKFITAFVATVMPLARRAQHIVGASAEANAEHEAAVQEIERFFASLSSRIAALLPPEGPTR